MKRRGFLGLLGATALPPIAALQMPADVTTFTTAGNFVTPADIGRIYAQQLAEAMIDTRETIVARVMDRTFNEIWWSYPNKSALFEWLDKGAVLPRAVDRWECAGHGDYRPVYREDRHVDA